MTVGDPPPESFCSELAVCPLCAAMGSPSGTLVYCPQGERMSRTIELPDSVYAALEKAAQANGTTAADWIAAQIPATTDANGEPSPRKQEWIDRDFLKTYAQDADESVSLDEVRRAMAKIPGRLADDIRAVRDER